MNRSYINPFYTYLNNINTNNRTNMSTNTTTTNNNNNNRTESQYISILYTMYNDNYRLINQLRNDNLQLRNYIVSEYERNRIMNTNTNTNMNMNNNIRQTRRNPFPRTPFPNFTNLQFTNPSFFDNVPVPPTQEQIELATLNTCYSNVVDPLNNTCPITLETFENNSNICLIKYCGHIFKPESLRNWFVENNRCPVCRFDIRNYTPSTNDHYELIDNSNINISNIQNDNNIIHEDISSNNSTNNTNDTNDTNDTNINTNSANNNRLRINTDDQELTQQIDNILTQLFQNLNNSDTTIDNDLSGNFIISYTLT